MSYPFPKIRLRPGDVVSFDGDEYEIVERAEAVAACDHFAVDDGTNTLRERHVDWFAERAAEAGRVVIARE